MLIMLLGTRPNVKEILIHCFRISSCLSANEIYEWVAKVRKVSKRTVLKELANLIQEGVLIKLKERYLVKSTWIFDLMHLAEDLRNKQQNRDNLLFQLPGINEKKTWKLFSVRRLDAFWEHIIFILYKLSRQRTMYVWVPHYWFHLIDFRKEQQIFRAMHIDSNKRFYLIGGDTFIDRMPEKFWDRGIYRWVHNPIGFRGNPRIWYCVIDDYILSGTFTKSFTHECDSMCKAVQSEDELNFRDVQKLVDRRTTITVTLERNSKKARRLTEQFLPYFHAG